MSRARTRFRLRRWGRRLFLLASAGALLAGMGTAVERGSRARRLSEEVDSLERREAEARSRVAEAMRRVDSLSSRERIAREAAALGLRPASDEEITFLPEPGGDADGEERP